MLAHDLRCAIRGLLLNRGVTLATVGSLAVAIGGSVAVFTVLNAIVLRSLPIEEPDQLFEALRATTEETVGRFAWPPIQRAKADFAARGTEMAAASNIAGMQLGFQSQSALDTERGFVQLVSGEYFELLRQQPQRGRLLAASDNSVVGAHPVVVISDSLWRRRFAASEEVVGQRLAINGTEFSVVGVTKPEFFGTTVAVRTPDAWIPLMMQSVVRYAVNASSHDGADVARPWPPQEAIEWLSLFVRVPRGTDPSSVAAELTVLRQREADSGSRSGSIAEEIQQERVLLEPASRGLSPFRESVSATLYILLSTMGVLLAIACINVAGLLTARASAREREMAIRLSIGAGQWQLIRQALAESLLVGTLAGTIGVLLAYLSREALLNMLAVNVDSINLNTGFDLTVVGVAVAISVGTGVMGGLLPAVRSARIAVIDAIKSQERGTSPGQRTRSIGKALVTIQTAFCLVALVLSGLFVHSLQSLTAIDIGYDRENVLTARVDIRSLGYRPEQRQMVYSRILDQIRAIPGVTSVSLSLIGPMVGGERIGGISVEGYSPGPSERLRSNSEIVSRDYFQTVGLKLVRGRLFGPEDEVPGGRNTIVNETVARRYFGDREAIGKRWAFGGTVPEDSFVVVGVVEDAKYVDLRGATPNMVYQLAATQPAQVLGDVEVRTSVPPASMVSAVRRAIADVEPQLPVFDLIPVADRMQRRIGQDRLIATLTTIFSSIALALACLGLYGTVSYTVNRRIPEIGLRMAVGADRRSIHWMVISEALRVVLVGAALGAPFAYVAATGIRAMLYDTSPMDPGAYGFSALLLMVVSLAAAHQPARRASRIDPMKALNCS